jgi:hypothetical protein
MVPTVGLQRVGNFPVNFPWEVKPGNFALLLFEVTIMNYTPLSIATTHGPQRNTDGCLAQAVYATGSPLMHTGDVYWNIFFKCILSLFN